MNLRERLQGMAQTLVIVHHSDLREGHCAVIETWALQQGLTVSAAFDVQRVAHYLSKWRRDLPFLDMELLSEDRACLLELIIRHAPQARLIAWMMYLTIWKARHPVEADACALKEVPAHELKQVIVHLLPAAFQHTT